MLELERWKKSVAPPDKAAWNDQMYQARLFNELVYNADTNLGNVVIDKAWKVWLVDFTRAFRLRKTLKRPENIRRVDRRVWDNLQRIDDGTIRQALGDALLDAELEALLARRAEIVRLLTERVRREGEAAVVYDLPGH